MNLQKSLFLVLIGLLATDISLFSTKPSQAAPSGTTFQCIAHRGGADDAKFATIAINKLGKKTDPILLWKSNYFASSGYTPERRCFEVTDRLNNAISKNGGKLGNLFLTGGRIPGRVDPVICYVNNSYGGCNSSNVLFTLSAKNRDKVGEILSSLINFSVKGSGSPIQESQGQPYVNLEELVDNALGESSEAEASDIPSGVNTPSSSVGDSVPLIDSGNSGGI